MPLSWSTFDTAFISGLTILHLPDHVFVHLHNHVYIKNQFQTTYICITYPLIQGLLEFLFISPCLIIRLKKKYFGEWKINFQPK